MSQLSSFNNYMEKIGFTGLTYDFKNKKRNVFTKVLQMLDRTQSMFTWLGLPDTIPQYILERFLQTNGDCIFYEYKNNLYVFVGGAGGEPDVYFRPTLYTIANPALNLSKQLKIDDECIICLNDSNHMGLLPMYTEYATKIVETELSIDIATVNSRIISLLSASDDRTKLSAEKYIEDIRNGEQGIIAETPFLDGVRTQPYTATGNNTIISLIELLQYHRASWFNDIGLSANYNMKREALNSGESSMNNDILLPLIDNMLICRKEACEKVNAKYGLNISVELSSSWEDNQEEIENELNSTDDQTENDSKEVSDSDTTVQTE